MTETSRRAQNKRIREQRILDAAMRVFADHGYAAATMDLIAKDAGLTKPTLYQYFANKDTLFKAMLSAPRAAMVAAFENADSTDLVAQLYDFAWRYADTVMRADLLSLARLIIGEAHRFPEIGRSYQASGPDQVLNALKTFMMQHGQSGRLHIEDAELAAHDFWGLILSAPRNQALHEPDNIPDRDAISRSINNGLKVFLRAYSTQPDTDLAKLKTLTARVQ